MALRQWIGRSGLAFVSLLVSAALLPAAAQVARRGGGDLDRLKTAKTAAVVPTRHLTAEQAAALKGTGAVAAFRALAAASPAGAWRMTFDAATGRAAMLEGREPWLSGAVNPAAGTTGALPAGAATKDVPKAAMAERAVAFLKANPDLFGVDPRDLRLMDGASGPFGNDAYFVDFQWTHRGIDVENAHVVFRVNHGALVQVGQELVSPEAIASLDATPALAVEDAWNALWNYVGGRRPEDRIAAPARLLIAPEAAGDAIAYRLVYVATFVRGRRPGTWEGRIDAKTGEVVRFLDANVYGGAHGHALTLDQPSQEQDRPFAFADVSSDGSGGYVYADAGGRFAGDAASSSLVGKRVQIIDECGPISLSTTTGDLDFGASPAGDCATPGVGGAGNTRAARTQFYNINKIKQKALTYLPSNTWLAQSVLADVNILDTCNANWNPATGSLNFFRSGGICGNTGELPGVSLHEFAHGLDTNDGDNFSPDKGTGETYGDFTAALQTHQACLGSGFFQGYRCYGYGDYCKTCTGVRDIDFADREAGVPVTPSMLGGTSGFRCDQDSSYPGPCGYEGHCESYVGSEAMWDLANRDLPAQSALDVASAWQLVDRLWYTSRPTATANYACDHANGDKTDGCGAGSMYSVLRAADDDDGDLTNGTPHAAAIYSALARHGIACGAATDAANQSHAACVAPGKPALTALPGDGQAALNWAAVPGAAKYRVLRNEDGCTMGFTKVADVLDGAAAGYTDASPLNAMQYFYRVQAVGAVDACEGPVSDCAAIEPVPRAGTLTIDRGVVNCSDQFAVTLKDADLIGAGTQQVQVFSAVDATPFALTLTETGPRTGVFVAQLATIAAARSQDGKVAVADGATITVRYADAAPAARTVDATTPVDCRAPAISDVVVTATDVDVTVSWTTDEPTTTRLVWGAAAPPTTVVDGAPIYTTAHSATVRKLSACTTYYFDVVAEDKARNATTDDQSGLHRPTQTGGRIFSFKDTVENGQGLWTPKNGTGSAFHVSTCRSHSPSHAWKVGAVDCDGSYAASTSSSLESATIDLGAAGHGYHLRYWEWGNTEMNPETGEIYDKCAVQISADGGNTWTDLVEPYGGSSNGWAFTDLDLAAYSGPVKLRFHFTSDYDWQLEGWYLDDIEVSRAGACVALPTRTGLGIVDACHGAGAAADGVADPGEHLRLPVTLTNNGPIVASRLAATLSTTAPGVVVTNGATRFPDLTAGATATSIDPQFTVAIPAAATCGTQIPFTMHMTSDAGSWDDAFAVQVGANVAGAPTKLLDEHFDFPSGASSSWLPTGWKAAHSGSQQDWKIITYSSSYDCTGNGKSGMFHYTGSTASDAWLFSKGLALKAGTTYTLGFNVKSYNSGIWYMGVNLAIKLGNAQDAAHMTLGDLWSTEGFTNAGCVAQSLTFTVPADGTYYLGVHDVTPASTSSAPIVDDFVLTAPNFTCAVHACAPGTLTAPGETATAIDAELNWTAGSKDTLQWGADPAATSGYRLYRGAFADLAHLADGQPNSCLRWSGAATTTGATLTDAPAGGAVQWFLLSGVNDAGEGPAGAGRTLAPRGLCQ